MVRLSNQVEEFLNDIFFYEFGSNVNTPNYWKIIGILQCLDKKGVNRILGRYPAWRRMGWFEKEIGNYIFGYVFDGTNVLIKEAYRVVKESDIKQITLSNSQFIRLLTESVMRILVKLKG